MTIRVVRVLSVIFMMVGLVFVGCTDKAMNDKSHGETDKKNDPATGDTAEVKKASEKKASTKKKKSQKKIPVKEIYEVGELRAEDFRPGADLVVGHHSHIWQPVEVIDGVPVVYGIGNFAFGSRNRNAVGGLIVRVVIKDKKVSRVELYPTYTMNRSKQVRFQPKVLKGRSAQETLQELKRESEKRGATISIENGVGVLNF